MNRMIVLSMLVLSACAGASGAMRNSAESFAGPWHGVLEKGGARSAADFRFSRNGGGSFWGRELTPIALSNVRLGDSVHFEIPDLGVFDGTSSGDAIEGTFHDANGGGSFRIEKEVDQDDPRYTMF